MDPAGKVAVVTGGNSGLGEAAALRLAAVGAKVVTLDNTSHYIQLDRPADVIREVRGLLP